MSPELLLSHRDWVRRLAAALLPEDPQGAEDVAQEALLVAWEAQSDAQPVTRGWLRGVVLNQVRRFRRVKRRSGGVAELEVVADEASGPEKLVQFEAVRSQLVRAVLALPNPGQRIVILSYYEGLTIREIAERLGMSRSNVAEQLKRSLKRLELELNDRSDDVPALWAGLALLARPARKATRPAAWAAPAVAALLAATAGLGAWLFADGAGASRRDAATRTTLAANAGREHSVPITQDAARRDGFPAEAADTPALERKGAAAAVASAAIEPISSFPGRAMRLRGAVQAPAAGVRVIGKFRTESGGEVQVSEATSDKTGLLELWNPFPNEHAVLELHAATDDAGEELVLDPPRLRLVPGERHTLGVLAFTLDSLVEGTVRDEHELPLADVELRCRTVTTRTAADGGFSMRVPSGDAGFLYAVAPGYGVVRKELGTRKPEDVITLPITLRPERVLRGVVRHRGRPVQQASVGPMIPATPIPRVTTDEEGRFVLAGLDARSEELLTVEAEGLPAWAGSSGTADQLEIDLDVGGSVYGRVVDEVGEPIPLAHLVLGPGVIGSAETFSDEAGNYSFPLVKTGKWRLCVWRPGYASAVFPDVMVTASGETRQPVVLREGRTIELEVLAPEGQAVQNALASIVGGKLGDDGCNPTGAEGRVLLRDLSADPLVVEVCAVGFLRKKVELQAGPGPITFSTMTLERSGRVAGTVIDGSTGLPVTAFDVRFGPSSAAGAAAITPQWGGVRSSGGKWDTLQMALELPPGADAALEVVAPGYASQRLDPLPIGTAGDYDVLEVRLDPLP